MSGFVEEDGDEVIGAAPEKGIEDGHFWGSVVGAAGMSAYAASCTGGSEEDNGIPHQLDVGFQGCPLLICEGFNFGVEF